MPKVCAGKRKGWSARSPSALETRLRALRVRETTDPLPVPALPMWTQFRPLLQPLLVEATRSVRAVGG